MTKLDSFSNEEIIELVNNSYSMAELVSKLGYQNKSGDLYKRVNHRLDELQLDRSHFKRQTLTKRTPENVFIKDSTADQRTLRRHYYNGEYTPYVCSICQQPPIWQGKEMTLILDHINGINNDDRLDNLRWVCPNCNSQLPTTNGKNIPRLKMLVQD